MKPPVYYTCTYTCTYIYVTHRHNTTNNCHVHVYIHVVMQLCMMEVHSFNYVMCVSSGQSTECITASLATAQYVVLYRQISHHINNY